MKIFSLFISVMLSVIMTAQAPPISWQKTYGGFNYDGLAVVNQTPDGGFIFGGRSGSPVSGDKSVPNKGGQDIWLVKADASGMIQWQKTLGGNEFDSCTTILLTSDGGYLIGGDSDSGISGDKTVPSKGFGDIWLLKLNNLGSIEWQKSIGGSYADIIRSITPTPDGGYIIGASSVSSISGDKTEDNIGLAFGLPYYTYLDYWIIKIDALGNIEWDNTIGTKLTDGLSKTILTSDGGYLLGGYSLCDNTGDYIGNAIGNFDLWILKLDASGNILWQKTIGGTDKDQVQALISTSDGGYVFGLVSNSDASGDKTENSKGGDDFWILKTDSEGNVLWDKTIGGSGSDVLYALTKDNNDNFYLIGPSNSGISGNKSEASKGGNDFWVVKTDNNGNILWDKTIGGSLDDEGGALTYLADDDSIIFGGQSNSSISGDKTENSRGNYDYWIVKLESDQLTKSNFTASTIGLYPNPTTKTIHLDFAQTYSNIQTVLTTVTGQTVGAESFFNAARVSLDINTQSGMYFLKVKNESNETINFKIIKQ